MIVSLAMHINRLCRRNTQANKIQKAKKKFTSFIIFVSGFYFLLFGHSIHLVLVPEMWHNHISIFYFFGLVLIRFSCIFLSFDWVHRIENIAFLDQFNMNLKCAHFNILVTSKNETVKKNDKNTEIYTIFLRSFPCNVYDFDFCQWPISILRIDTFVAERKKPAENIKNSKAKHLNSWETCDVGLVAKLIDSA